MKYCITPIIACIGITIGFAPPTWAEPPALVDDMIPILDQDFSNGLNKYDGQTGLWSTETPRGGLITNAEETVFLDPEAPGVPWAATPPTLSLVPDGLSIRTVRIPDAALEPVRNQMQANGQGKRAERVKYATGRITTTETWAQVYGWFEIEAQIPRGKGRWPAFWLNFAGPGWPPEIDVFEAYGEGIAAPTDKDGRFNTAVLFDGLDAAKRPVHNVDIVNTFDDDPERRTPRTKERAGRLIYTFTRHNFDHQLDADIYGQVNTYAALWTPDEIIFYFGPDRASLREIYRTPTPEDANDPMFILANDQFTARGGSWDADADLDAVLDPDNDFLIKSIKVRAFAPDTVIDMARGQTAFTDQSTVIQDTPVDDIIAPRGGFDVVNLSTGADEIRISRGREGKVITGFGPDDRLVLEGFTFFDSADAHARLTQVDDDVWLSSGADPFWPQSIILRDTTVDAISPAQIESRWPVGRNVWATRADLTNKSESDDDRDGVITAPAVGGWMNDRGRPVRLNGGEGPERYLVSNPRTRIVEPEDGNIDTLIAWGTWTLPDNVERGILRGNGGRLMGSGGPDRLEAEGRGGQLSGGVGDDLYVIDETAFNTTIRIENAAGHDRLRGYAQSHNLLVSPALRATATEWQWEQADEGVLITFNPTQSLLIEGIDLAERGVSFELP